MCGHVLRSLLVGVLVLAVFGCQRSVKHDGAEDINVDLTLRPEPPHVGNAATVVQLTDRDARPVRGAVVKLEGNMNHPGMKPSFADAMETDPGKYEATLDFTMGGDWFILVHATLADGRKLQRKLDVPAVRSR
jgi:hypothetical protein